MPDAWRARGGRRPADPRGAHLRRVRGVVPDLRGVGPRRARRGRRSTAASTSTSRPARAIEAVLAPYNLGRLNPLGLNLCAPALFAHGTEEQRLRFLPRIVDNTEKWCQLFSEPGAGLRPRLARHPRRARRRRLGAHRSEGVDHVGARVGLGGVPRPHRPRRRRSATASPTSSSTSTRPASTVRPLRHITGEVDFNEVFLDGVPGARRPAGRRARATAGRSPSATLSGERQMVSGAGSGGVDRIGGSGADACSGSPVDDRAARSGSPACGARSASGHGRTAACVAAPLRSLGKVHQGDLNQRIQLAAVDLLGRPRHWRGRATTSTAP